LKMKLNDNNCSDLQFEYLGRNSNFAMANFSSSSLFHIKYILEMTKIKRSLKVPHNGFSRGILHSPTGWKLGLNNIPPNILYFRDRSTKLICIKKIKKLKLNDNKLFMTRSHICIMKQKGEIA